MLKSVIAGSLLILITPSYADLLSAQLHAKPMLTAPKLELKQNILQIPENILTEYQSHRLILNFYQRPVNVAEVAEFSGLTPYFDDKDKAYKITSRRTDLRNIIGANPHKLNSWAEFKSAGSSVGVSGSLIVTQNQIEPMINMLLKNHLKITGLHDHIGNESPSILYLKFEGTGSEKELAMTVSKAFKSLLQGEKSESFPLAIMDIEATTLNTKLVDHLMKSTGEMQDGVYLVGAKHAKNKVARPKSDISFSGSNEQAMVEGDLVLNQDQLEKIVPILQHAGISILAIKESLPIQEDKIIQVHYYGIGKVASLASGLQKALNVSTES